MHMAGTEALRGDIDAALCTPNFTAIAARLTGGFLRQVVAHRLTEARIDVVVIAANGLGDVPPYKEAEIIWQPPQGGEFVRQTVRWELAPWAFSSRAGFRQTHVVIDCDQCGQTNAIAVDGGGSTAQLSCFNCGAALSSRDAEASLVSRISGRRRPFPQPPRT
jgi:hypothetical protein